MIYERLGTARQIRLHRRLGERLEAGYGDQVGEIAGELALHFTQGQDIARAVHYDHLAAKTASARHALHEVLNHCRSGLAQLASLPASTGTRQQELDLLIMLGTTLIATEGHAVPAVIETYTRAETLCRQINDDQRLVPLLLALRAYHFVSGDMRVANDYSQQLLELASQEQIPLQLNAAHMAMGNSLLFSGRIASARDHLDQAIHYSNPQLRQEYMMTFGADIGVICHLYRAWALNHLGYFEQARRDIDTGLAMARELTHPFSMGMALNFAAMDRHFHDDREKLKHYIDESLGYCDRQGLVNLAAQTRVFQGWLRVKQGQHGAGISQMEQALNELHTSGYKSREAYYVFLLIDAYRDTQRYPEALQVLQQSLSEVIDRAMYIFYPKLLRLQGELELLLATSPQQIAAAERCFRKAIVICRRQQSRTLELRATVCLSRLWQTQGRHEQAQRMLQTLYDRFSEGFDRPDLRRARTLLDNMDDEG